LGDVGDLVVICRIEIKLPSEVTVFKKLPLLLYCGQWRIRVVKIEARREFQRHIMIIKDAVTI
jgi:hypothetical protein